jgi:two-component system sensor kinase FixL
VAKSRGPSFGWAALILLLWLATVGLFLLLTTGAAIQRATDELNATGFALHRFISQRVAQHDAHLTSLIALILATDTSQQQSVRQVAQSIMRFYPRITGINLVELAETGDQAGVTSRPVLAIPDNDGIVDVDHAAFFAAIFKQRAGEVRTYVDKDLPGHYILGKKVNDTNPGLAVVMRIDPSRLVEPEELPEWTHLRLSIDGQVVADRPAAQLPSSWLPLPRFIRTVDSQSQPLLLSLERPLALFDVIDLRLLSGVALTSLIGLLLFSFGWRQRMDARQLRLAASAAEERAKLLERETRLAHASRVNSLGELASGIAHELTQPLTALMSQSQAAQRLFDQEPTEQATRLLSQALKANVREAKRAGEMLKRMRDYISNREPTRIPTDINQVVRDISNLVKADLERRAITLKLELSPALPILDADPVELEQVLNNLVRNAADSLEQSASLPREIRIETGLQDDNIIVAVTDNGPGIADTVLPRLFEPFFTTKQDGMGLGLSLCATLVERIGGRITADNAPESGAQFTIIMPAASPAPQDIS